MRFVMISLLIDCLLFLGISYLAFGDIEIGTTYETRAQQRIYCTDDAPCGSSFETSQQFRVITPEIGCIMCQRITERKTGTVLVSKIQ